MGDKEENSELLIDEKTLPADVEFDLRQEMHAQQLHDDDAASTSSAQGRHGALRPAGSTDCLLNTSAGGSEDATPVARRTMNRTAHASMPDLSFAGRRQQYTSGGRTTPVKPMSMREYDQTLTHLRKENWNLKLKLFLLEGKIPKLNVELSVEVESLRKERAAEEERFTQMSNDITLLRRNAEREVDSLSNEIQLLRKQNDAQIDESRQLQHKLFAAQKQVIDLEAELRYARENFNGSDSEGNSNVSLLSERDRRILQLESAVVDKDYVAIELKHDYEDRLQRLQELLDKRQNISLTDSGDKTADALSTRVDRLEQHLATTKQRLSDAQKRPTTRDSDSMTVTTGADLEDLAARCEKYRQYARAVRSKVSAIEEDVRRRQSSENAADGSPHQRSLSPTRLSLGGLDRLTETVIKERQNSADLSAIIRQLQANNKELNRRLLENNDVIRTANERIAEKQQQCTQLSDALRRTEQRIVEERTKRLSIPISPSNSWSSLDAAQKSSLPEADMATPSDVSPKGSRHGASSDRLKQEMQEGVRRARRLLKYVKAMSDSAATIKTEDWKRLDDEVRALRYALDHCVHLMSTSSKENVAPGAGHDQQQFEVDRLKVENERLREYLLSSQQMLQEAQGRLQSQPMGIPSDINDGIVRELSKMRQVMQKTRQDVTTMQSRRGGSRPRT
uniref:Centrosomin N-terminal motif 1 domain-containing protein n=1 Tax=Plectus sambesii TaxID=2011161 RepID=A0A914XNM9_9BILA